MPSKVFCLIAVDYSEHTCIIEVEIVKGLIGAGDTICISYNFQRLMISAGFASYVAYFIMF